VKGSIILTEKNEASKTKDKRLEETKRLEVEVHRSLAVVKMKEAHKAIEDAEKSRKRSAVLSIIGRISFHAEGLLNCTITMMALYKPYDTSDPIKEEVRNYLMTYESLRYDLKKTTEINDEDFEKLFPKLEVKSADMSSVLDGLHAMSRQDIDMLHYLTRML
jgi:hypothetical protein